MADKTGVKTLENLMMEKMAGLQEINESQAKHNQEVGDSAAPKTGLEAVIEARSGESVEDLTEGTPKTEAKEVKQEKPKKKVKAEEISEPIETQEIVQKPKFWESKEDSKVGTPEEIDYVSKYKELESKFNELKTQKEQVENNPEIKFAKKIKEAGGINNLISKLKSEDPSNKSPEKLLIERVTRTLEGIHGKDMVTEDMIEEQMDKVNQRDVLAINDMIEAEKKYQTEIFNKELDEFKPSESLEAESFAKDLEAMHTSSLGKEILGLAVTPDRQQKMEQIIEAYSKGERKLTGSNLYEALYFLEHKGEIFDNVIKNYGTAKIEAAVAKVEGSERRVSAGRTADTGAVVKSAEEQDREEMMNLFLGPVREAQQKLAQKQGLV